MRVQLRLSKGRLVLRRIPDEEVARAARALSLVQLGEISVGRQALEGACLALGLVTLGILTDPNRTTCPTTGDSSIGASQLYELDPVEFLFLYKEGRRGAAPGPSEMTSDHLFLVFESDAESELFIQVR